MLEKLGGKPGCLEVFLSRIKAFLIRRIGMGRLLPQRCLISGKGDSYLGLPVVLLEGQLHDVWEDKHIWTFPIPFYSAGIFRISKQSPLDFFFFPCQGRKHSLDKKEGSSLERQCALNRDFVFISILRSLQISASWRRAAALQGTFLTRLGDG